MDNQTYRIAHGTLFKIMCQPGWERGLGKKWIHVYGWLSPFTVHLKLSPLLTGYTPIQDVFGAKK